MSKVSIVECNSYEKNEVRRALEIAVNNSEFPKVKGKKILLKPNILDDANPDECVTTNPEILRTVIAMLKERGASEIYVGDSPALEKPGFKPIKSGIYQVCIEENVPWVDFTKEPVSKKVPYVNHKVMFAKIIDEVDFCINLPKLKTHEFMVVTGAVKNLFGLMPSLRKSAQHVRHPSRGSFAKLMCGIYAISKADYTIMDAVYGMEGPGPRNGNPIGIHKIIAGRDAVAVDIAQATIMGHSIESVPVLKFAKEEKIGDFNPKYPLFDPKDLVIRDFNRIGNDTVSDQGEAEYLKRKIPSFNNELCIACGKCVEICPAKALELNGIIKIKEEKCIRCYCCHEICPAKAINV